MSQSGFSFSFKGSSVFSSTGAGDGLPHAPTNKLYWLVQSKENGELTIQPLDEREWQPMGSARPISVRELQSGLYKPEPDIYHDFVLPRLKGLGPVENVAPVVDEVETNLRDMFAKASQQIEKGNLDDANFLFKQMLGHGSHAQKQHRHLFNEFGINMRKNNMRPQAVDFYTKALELSGDDSDENLHFNLARALFEEERYLACTQQLFKALKISPNNWAVLRFLAWMQKSNLIPKQYLLDVQAKLNAGIPDIPDQYKNEQTASQSPAPAQISAPSGKTAQTADAESINPALLPADLNSLPGTESGISLDFADLFQNKD